MKKQPNLFHAVGMSRILTFFGGGGRGAYGGYNLTRFGSPEAGLFPVGGHSTRAVASLTVPGGQEFYFPNFFLKF